MTLEYKDVVEHNNFAEKRHQWMEREGSVYEGEKFVQSLTSKVDITLFRGSAKGLKFTFLNRKGVRKSYIETAKEAAFVAWYQEQSPQEAREEYRSELLSLKTALEHMVDTAGEAQAKLSKEPESHAFILVDQTIGSRRNSYNHRYVFRQVSFISEQPRIGRGPRAVVAVCTRALRKLDILYIDYKHNPLCPGQDLNQSMFPLAWGVKPESLRKRLKQWEPFEFNIDENGAWRMVPVDVIKNSKTRKNSHLLLTLRPWLDTWEEFDTAVDGEVVWKVIRVDLVKEDKATKKQLAVWTKRAAVNNFYDKRLVDKRRKKMVRRRFAKHLQTFDAFAERMEKNLRELNALC